jgi:hypothetical protein
MFGHSHFLRKNVTLFLVASASMAPVSVFSEVSTGIRRWIVIAGTVAASVE